ncbi:MAG TPA: PIN domain-containing protein, partial [Actinomycetota bacterium]|nr:PIN domain-containing protein [Actinomycetota bacterium]
MIVVDTSVWVDVLNERDTAQARRYIELLEDGAPLALTDVILTELLQGFRSEREAARVERYLRLFPILRLETLEDLALGLPFYDPEAIHRSWLAREDAERVLLDLARMTTAERAALPVMAPG